jgi:hypothetical protein
MTQIQFMQRIQAAGGSEREAELIAALVYPEWRNIPATKVTRKQAEDICTLLYDRRQEDQDNARIDNEHINRQHTAGYVVRGACFPEVSR